MAACAAFGVVGFVNGGFASRLPQQFSAFARPPSASTPRDCLLIDRTDFSPKCTEVARRPAIFIWGDSHANSLAAGFDPLVQRGRVGKLQVTGANCPPLLLFKGNGNSKCEEINAYALDRIRRSRPDMVILHAMWESDAYDLTQLPFTVQQLRNAGVRNIVLVGPVPRWDGSLLRAVFRCWRPRSAAEEMPHHSKCGLDSHVAEVDATLREIARRLDVTYVSAYQTLCTGEGCLTYLKAANGSDELTTYDYGHVSVVAAEYLATTILESVPPPGDFR